MLSKPTRFRKLPLPSFLMLTFSRAGRSEEAAHSGGTEGFLEEGPSRMESLAEVGVDGHLGQV